MTQRFRTRAEIIARIAEIDAQIDDAPGWGAAITVLEEERRGLLRTLESLAPWRGQ